MGMRLPPKDVKLKLTDEQLGAAHLHSLGLAAKLSIIRAPVVRCRSRKREGILVMAQWMTRKGRVLQDPRFAQILLGDVRFSLLWLPIRIWLGYQWLQPSLGKINNPAWVVTGEALRGFWANAVQVPAEGRPPIAFDWYRSFLQVLLDAQAYTWFGKLVAYGELLVGIALILGAFTGIVAFLGAFMNFNYMLAGTASTNPLFFVVAIGVMFAWKIAGYIGADYFLLRWIGVPWELEPVSEDERALPVSAGGARESEGDGNPLE